MQILQQKPYDTVGKSTSERQGEKISIDICGPYTVEFAEEVLLIYIVNFIDNCDRFVVSDVTPEITAKTIHKAMKTPLIKPYWTPIEVLCDQGNQLT